MDDRLLSPDPSEFQLSIFGAAQDTYTDASPDAPNAVPLIFDGPITPNGPNITLTGTVESVYTQILALNPSYNPWEFPEYRKNMLDQFGAASESDIIDGGLISPINKNKGNKTKSLVKRDSVRN